MGFYADMCDEQQTEIEYLKEKIEKLEQALRDSGDEDMISDIECELREKYGLDEEDSDEDNS